MIGESGVRHTIWWVTAEVQRVMKGLGVGSAMGGFGGLWYISSDKSKGQCTERGILRYVCLVC